MSIAENIIEKCGGVQKTASLVGKHPSWVYRWRYSTERGGTGGIVPRSSQTKLLKLAAQGKVDIKPADFFDGAA